MPEEFKGKLTERQIHYLVTGANDVRKLIRVKIADDNDLEQAREALKTTDKFFKALYKRAEEGDSVNNNNNGEEKVVVVVKVKPFDLLKKSGAL